MAQQENVSWNSRKEGFPVLRTRQIDDIPIRNLQDSEPDATFYSSGQTRFQQGELGNCWLVAAIESLRQENNQEAFEKVVPVHGTDLEFRFWHNGAYQLTVSLATDAVPTTDKESIFTCNVEGSDCWGILLEKAYAKWVGSYEGLDGGFWTDAIQSFTGGVVERIKIRNKDGNVLDNLFDIMLASYSKGSSLCCIKKIPDNRETYHSCCIKAVKIDEDDNRIISVQDPATHAQEDLAYDEFTKTYHRLDMCHTNLDNLSALQRMDIAPTPWESQIFHLQLENGQAYEADIHVGDTEGHCVPQPLSVVDKFNINLTGKDDEQEHCILVIELIQKIKPDEGKQVRCVKPWEAVVCLEAEVDDEGAFAIKVPQGSHCFILKPGTFCLKVSTDEKDHEEICMRVFSKTKFEVEKQQED